ncbi:MAG TPA: glycosyltransferase family 2 protein [Gaiellaceae bacterium]|nr:glycosyltransferase family 2 protein [Gaiellaceae bacterium]
MGEPLARPSLSVVVVAYRSGPSLQRCLSAVCDDRPDAEVIVVDNGGAEPGRDQALVVEAGGNLGYAGGAALGASKASGDVLVFLNQDTVVERGALEALAGTLEDTTVGIAMARLRLLDRPELLNSGGTVVHLSGIAWAGRFEQPVEGLATREDVPAPSGAALAIRRELYDELGGFSPELFMYLEDLELGWRARLHGLNVVVEPGADVLHEYEFSRNADKLALLERNRLVFVLSAYSLRLLLLLGPVLFAVELAMLGLSTRQRWLGGKVRGYGWLLARPRWLLRHRRETQRLRRVRDRELVRFLTPILDPRMIELPRGAGAFNSAVQHYWRVVEKLL